MKISISVIPILRLVLTKLSSKLGPRTFMCHEYVFHGFPKEVFFSSFGNAGVGAGDRGYAAARQARASPNLLSQERHLTNFQHIRSTFPTSFYKLLKPGNDLCFYAPPMFLKHNYNQTTHTSTFRIEYNTCFINGVGVLHLDDAFYEHKTADRATFALQALSFGEERGIGSAEERASQREIYFNLLATSSAPMPLGWPSFSVFFLVVHQLFVCRPPSSSTEAAATTS